MQPTTTKKNAKDVIIVERTRSLAMRIHKSRLQTPSENLFSSEKNYTRWSLTSCFPLLRSHQLMPTGLPSNPNLLTRPLPVVQPPQPSDPHHVDIHQTLWDRTSSPQWLTQRPCKPKTKYRPGKKATNKIETCCEMMKAINQDVAANLWNRESWNVSTLLYAVYNAIHVYS